MRKIIASIMVSIDGFFAGSNGEIDWHIVDDAFNEYAIELLQHTDTLLFGRTTYQLFESYWPQALTDPTTSCDDLIIAKKIDTVQKIVFSKTLAEVTWNNSQLLKDITVDEIMKVKEDKSNDIVIYGSGSIVAQLTRLGLIDEYRFIVNPVILGEGRSLFRGIPHTIALSLTKIQQLTSGNVLLIYNRQKQ